MLIVFLLTCHIIFYRKQQEKELGLNSDDDSEPEESSRSSNKAFPRRSLAIQSGHKVRI